MEGKYGLNHKRGREQPLNSTCRDPLKTNHQISRADSNLDQFTALMIVFIIIGYSKQKKNLVLIPKFKILTSFYTIVLILMLSGTPGNHWF